MDLRIIVGIAFLIYGLTIVLRPNKYMEWSKKQQERFKITAPVRYLWQAKTRGIIYIVIALIAIVWGILT